jgi:Signal transduction histidine kinase
MAKKRMLKKYVSFFAGELFAETLLVNLLNQKVDQAKCEELMTRIVDMQEEFTRRVNHSDAKDNKTLVKEYYKKLKVDFQQEVMAIAKEIEALGKA